MPLPELMLRFRKSIWFRVLYVAVLLLLLSTLLLVPLAWLLAPATLLVIPYWLRERGYKKYIVNGIVAIVGAVLFLAAYSAATISVKADSPVLSGGTPGIALTNGTVAPFRGVPGESFTFAVDLLTLEAVPAANATVWLNLSYFDASLRPVLGPGVRMSASNASDAVLTDGKRYTVNASALDRVYFFSFSAAVNLSTGRAFAETFADTGPVVTGFWSHFGVLAWLAGQFAFIPTLVYFLALAGHRIWRRSQARAAATAPRKEVEALEKRDAEEAEGEFTCTNCGADVPAAAARCPKCGAVFEEGPEVPPAETPPRTEGRNEGR